MAKPYLPDKELIAQVMMSPALNGNKKKRESVEQINLKREIRKADFQQAINRYEWFNLPDINGYELERLLYLKGQLMGFYKKSNDTFYFLPFALESKDNTGIDVYGRYTHLTPVQIGSDTDGKSPKPLLAGLNFEVVYDIKEWESEEEWRKDFDKYCVILRDYTPQISQSIIPQAVLQDTIINIESEVIPLMRTSLINNTGTMGVRVSSADEESNVQAANQSKVEASLNGESYIPIVGQVDFQELDAGKPLGAADYLQAYQAIDNIRCGFMGIGSGNTYQKTEHMLQSEADMNSSPIDAVIQDGLYQRQQFCNLFNSIFGTTIWCEIKSKVDAMMMPGEKEEEAMTGGHEEGHDEVGGADNE